MEIIFRSNYYLLIVLVPPIEVVLGSAQASSVSFSLLAVKPDYGLRKVCWEKLGHLKKNSSIKL